MSSDFVPASSLAPIPGTSYSLRIGKIDGKWAVRVYRGREILSTEVIGELDPNIIVTVAQGAISLPSYSPYHIVRAASPLIREAKTGYVPPPEENPLRREPQASVQPVQTVQSDQPIESVLTNEAPKILDSALLSQMIGERVKEALAPSPISPPEAPQSVATGMNAKSVPQPKLEAAEKPKVAKKLDLKPIKSDELVDRTFSTLMQQLELVIAYVFNNYGEKSVARLWEYFADMAEVSQGKHKNESFEDFIRRRVDEDRILGVGYQIDEFYEDRFVGRVKRCGLKQKFGELANSTSHILQDLPCMLCESNWRGACKAMGFQLGQSREKDGCTVKVEKQASKK